MEDSEINFEWFKFIGRKKLAYTDKETMRLTVRQFMRVYNIYKNDYDMELCLLLNRMTYQKAKEESEKSQEWF